MEAAPGIGPRSHDSSSRLSGVLGLEVFAGAVCFGGAACSGVPSAGVGVLSTAGDRSCDLMTAAARTCSSGSGRAVCSGTTDTGGADAGADAASAGTGITGASRRDSSAGVPLGVTTGACSEDSGLSAGAVVCEVSVAASGADLGWFPRAWFLRFCSFVPPAFCRVSLSRSPLGWLRAPPDPEPRRRRERRLRDSPPLLLPSELRSRFCFEPREPSPPPGERFCPRLVPRSRWPRSL